MYPTIRLILKLCVVGVFCSAIMLAVLNPILSLVCIALIVVVNHKKDYGSTAFGSARFAEASEIRDLLTGSGVIVGHIAADKRKMPDVSALVNSRLSDRIACEAFITSCRPPHKRPQPLVRLTDAVHVAAFAPTNVGKTVSIVIPFVLSCSDSMVIVDFKGEIFRETELMRRCMGHRVVVLDPFDVARGKDSFNPLFDIDPESIAAPDECRDLAAAITIRTGSEHEQFWLSASEAEICLAIGFTVCFAPPEHKNLQFVSRVLSCSERRMTMIKACRESKVWGGILSRWGDKAAQLKDKTLASVLAHVHTNLSFLDTISLLNNTSHSTFDPADLRKGKLTIYLVIPPERLKAQTSLLRLWIGSLLRAVVKGGLSKRKVHYVLDEAASLSKMDQIDDAVDKYRAYGVRLLFLYQSIGQLRKCFPDGQDQTLLSNVTQIFFGVNDQQTATYVSDRLGDHTIRISSGGNNWGASESSSSSGQGSSSSDSRSRGGNSNWNQIARKLLKPDEVLNLHPSAAIVFHPSALPIICRLVKFYEWNFFPRQMSKFRLLVETASIVACVSILALMVTGLFHLTFK